MAIRELIRRGYWQEAAEDGADLPAAAGETEQAEGAEDGQQRGAEDEGRSLAEEIARSLNVGGKDDGGDEGQPEGEEQVADSEEPPEKTTSLPREQQAQEKKGEEEDPYAEPEGLKDAARSTQDRFHELVRMNKEKDAKVSEYEQQIAGFRQMIAETGATNEQLLELFDIAAMVYNPEKANPEEAVKRLMAAAENVSKAYGVPLPGRSMLDEFPDLKEKVENMEISQEAAEELAQARVQQRVQQRRQQAQQQTLEQQQAYIARRDQGLENLASYLMELEKNDIDFAAKAEHMKQAMAFAAENLEPEQWLPYAKQQYELVSRMATKASGSKEGDSGRPLRPAGARSGSRQPSDMAEAIKQSLGL